MTNQELLIIIKGKDEANRAFKSVSTELGKLEKHHTSLLTSMKKNWMLWGGWGECLPVPYMGTGDVYEIIKKSMPFFSGVKLNKQQCKIKQK